MLTAQIIIIAIVAIALVTSYTILSKRFTIPNRAFKILTAVLAVVFFVRYMWDRDLLMDIVALEGSQLDSVSATVVALVANWLVIGVIVLMLLHPFYSSSRSKIIVRYYGGAVLVLYLATLQNNTIALYGSDVYSGWHLRTTLMAIELGILVALVAIEWIRHIVGVKHCQIATANESTMSTVANATATNLAVQKYSEEITSDSNSYTRPHNTNKAVEVLAILALIAGIIVANWPSYFLQAVVVDPPTDIVYKGFSIQHIILYVSAFLLLIAMYLVLRYRQKSTIMHILTFISLSTIISFCNSVRFVDFADVADWPIHICNLSMYLIPICLIFHNRKIFYFMAFVSVSSAIIAMLFPNYDVTCNYASWQLVRFWTNHYTPLVMPFLMVMLGVYSPPTLKDVKYGIIGLAIFFVCMVLANAYCLDSTPDIDFFFLNGTQITSVLGVEFSRNVLWEWQWGGFHFMIYPVYFAVFFATMAGLCFVMCYIYKLLLMLDGQSRARRMRAQLLVQYSDK